MTFILNCNNISQYYYMFNYINTALVNIKGSKISLKPLNGVLVQIFLAALLIMS